MKWVKQEVSYQCAEIVRKKSLGQGICTAVLDTGIAGHPDLAGRIRAFRNFTSGRTDCHDDSGHGTHVAGILAGNGKMSNGIYGGMAPLSDLIAVKVLDHEGNGNVENVIRGIEWILKYRKKYRMRIVNISVGTREDLMEEQKQSLVNAVEELWDQGMVVVVSAGNYGPAKGSIAVPGNSPKVITVGVPDTAVRNIKGKPGKVNYSGRGPTARCVVKPDVFAPGTGIISCNARYDKKGQPFYIMKTGTSMAAPVVSGAIACLLSAYPDMSNVEVKLKLRESSDRCRGTEAGWGLLNVSRLMKV